MVSSFLWLLSKCMGCEEEDPDLVMNSYKDTCPQAEDVIKEQADQTFL